MFRRNLTTVISLLFISANICAQNAIAEAGIGVGSIVSNSSPQTVLDLNISVKYSLSVSNDLYFQAGFFEARKIDFYLPENREGKYYPYFRGFKLAVEAINPSTIADISYKAGLIILNDRMFDDRNNWTIGLLVGGGFYLLNSKNRFSLKLNADYAIAFDKNSGSYYSASLTAGYMF